MYFIPILTASIVFCMYQFGYILIGFPLADAVGKPWIENIPGYSRIEKQRVCGSESNRMKDNF